MTLPRWPGVLALLVVLPQLIYGPPPASTGLARSHAPTASAHVLLDAAFSSPRHWPDDDAGMARCLTGASGEELIKDPSWSARILLCNALTPCKACHGPSGQVFIDAADHHADLSTWGLPGLERHALSIGAPVPPCLRHEASGMATTLAATAFFDRPPLRRNVVRIAAWPHYWEPESARRGVPLNRP